MASSAHAEEMTGWVQTGLMGWGDEEVKDDAVRAQVLLMLMAEEKRMTKNSMQVTLSSLCLFPFLLSFINMTLDQQRRVGFMGPSHLSLQDGHYANKVLLKFHHPYYNLTL